MTDPAAGSAGASPSPAPPVVRPDPASALLALWRNGERPDLAAFLAGLDAPPPVAELAELVRIDQCERWRSGSRPRAEDYLAAHPALAGDTESAMVIVYGEFLLREERGEAPSAEEYRKRFPQFADRLAQQFDLHHALAAEAAASDWSIAPSRAGGGEPREVPVDPDSPGAVPQTLPVGDRRPPRRAPVYPEIAGYKILGELGRGGMGVVYKARQEGLDRLVALKMILSGPFALTEELTRFRIEAESVAQIQHPNIVQIHEVGESGGRPFLSLEYVEGGSLSNKIAGMAQPVRWSAGVVETLARAMHHAHKRGVVHRDLKPANILLTADGAPKIADFGLAKRLDSDPGPTRYGAAMGTPGYMAPEQAGGDPAQVGPAADVYALGAILYSLLTGRPPFTAPSDPALFHRILEYDATAPSRLAPAVPEDLDTICLKCLEKEPRRRYASASELADDLRRFLEDRPIRARPASLVETAVKWARRRPQVAGLTAALVVGAAVSMTAVTRLWLLAVDETRSKEAARQDAERQAGVAKAAQADAETQAGIARAAQANAETQAAAARKAEAEARHNLYLHAIALAQREWLAGKIVRAEQILDDPALPADARGWEWRHLKRLCHAELDSFPGPTGPIEAIAADPRGGRLAWCDSVPGVHMTDPETGRALEGIPSRGRLTALAFSRDGTLLAALGHNPMDNKPGLWVWGGGGRLIQQHPVLSLHPKALAAGPDNRSFAYAAGSAVKLTRLGEFDDKTLSEHPGGAKVEAVAFAPGGNQILSADSAGVIRIHDTFGIVTHVEFLVQFSNGYGVPIRSLAFDAEGKNLAVGAADGSVRLFRWPPGRRERVVGKDEKTTVVLVEESAVLQGHHAAVVKVAFGPNGTVAGASHDGTVKVWDPFERRERFTIRGHSGPVADVAYLPGNKRMVTAGGPAGRPGELKLWDAGGDPAYRQAADYFKVRLPVADLAFTADSRRLLAAGHNGDLLSCDPTGAAGPEIVWSHDRPMSAVAVTGDGHIISAAGDGAVRITDAAGRVLASRPADDPGHTTACFAAAPDGSLCAWATYDERTEFRLWAPAGRRESAVAVAEGQHVRALSFSGDGSMLAVGAEDGSLRIWDVAAGRWITLQVAAGEPVGRVAFSPDGTLIAVAGSRSGDVRVWDRAAGRVRHVLRGHDGPVHGLAFTPDSRRLATTGQDASVKVWDPAAGRELLTLRGSLRPGLAVAFSPDGRFLAAAGEDRIVRVWDSVSK